MVLRGELAVRGVYEPVVKQTTERMNKYKLVK